MDQTLCPTKLARLAVESWVQTGYAIGPPTVYAAAFPAPAGSFVTLRMNDGSLRGCMGTIEASRPSLADEIIMNAITAATRDPRFPPVSIEELTDLAYGVDVLSQLERVRGREDLDPARYGVVISSLDGRRRGVLLPAIDSVDSVERQWSIVHQKAGLPVGAQVVVYRFEVTRYGKD